jgi:hypothetical protein
MNGGRKSDSAIVPKKCPNNGGPTPAEGMEERALAKGNTGRQTNVRTQRRVALQQATDRVRAAARRNRKGKLTTLWHHVYNVDRLREARLPGPPLQFGSASLPRLHGREPRRR